MKKKSAPDTLWLIRYAAYTHLVEQIAHRPAAWTSLFSCIYTRYIADIDRFAAANHWTLSGCANGTPHPTFTAVHCCGYAVTVSPTDYQHICHAFQGYM